MAVVKPVLDVDEAFFPLNYDRTKGRILKFHELRAYGETIININQFGAIRAAQIAGGYVLSLAEDIAAVNYAKAHSSDDPTFACYYSSVTADVRFARFTCTQVHGLMSDRPLVVNVSRVDQEFDIPFYKERVIPAPWLPKRSGYVQELDQQTGLPRRVGKHPNSDLDNLYFTFYPERDFAAAIRFRHGLGLGWDINAVPSGSGEVIGVRLAKDFPPKNIERRVS